MLLTTVVTDLREDLRPHSTWFTFPDCETTVFADTSSKLSARLTNVELLREFACVFIYDVRRAESGNLILELEFIPYGVTVRIDHLK